MSHSGSLQDHDTLKRVEEQINVLSGILEQGRQRLRFPGWLERKYIEQRNQRFMEIDHKMLVAGLLFYLGFSWTDFSLGGDNGPLIFSLRVTVTLLAFLLVFWVPRSQCSRHMLAIAAGGIFTIGFSVIGFIWLIPGELKYAYHLGLIPIQIFTMVALRLSYRSVLVVSVALWLCYTVSLLLTSQSVADPELNKLIHLFLPMFVLFWALLIVMGCYMAFMMESAARNDFMKNRLLALEAERLKYLSGRLHVLSTTDSLTGIANRRFLEERVENEWRRGKRSSMPLALVMVDIDKFKDFNDLYGHQKGDQCLRALANKMAQFCNRPADLCARYGGEEFVLLFPETGQSDALSLAEKMRAAIEEMAIVHEASAAGVVTISAGVASVIPGDNSSADQLLSQADRLLYEAKAQGRNRVCG